MKAAPSRVYEFGDFRLNVARRLLGRRDGAAVPLTPKAFETLLYLVEHGGAVLDKEVLMEALWPDSIVEENNLSQNISTLRRVLGENPGAHCFIVTVPGRGYRFVADVTTREVSESEEIRETAVRPVAASGASAAGIAPSDRPAGRRKLQPLLLAALVLLAFSIAAIFVWRSTRFRSPDVLPASESSANTATPEKSIAVLPFENFSADKENAFFADGIQDDILTSLGKISDLKVISRTSASQYRGAGAARNLREVASALGVEHVLEGSVRRDGNRVLVNVQLIDARNDRHIWTEHYDRTITDSIGLQGELASEIAAALRAKLAPEEKAVEYLPTASILSSWAQNLQSQGFIREMYESAYGRPIGTALDLSRNQEIVRQLEDAFRRRLLVCLRVPRVVHGAISEKEESAPPPPTRMAFAGMPSSLKMVSVSLRLKATPSRIARTTCARV